MQPVGWVAICVKGDVGMQTKRRWVIIRLEESHLDRMGGKTTELTPPSDVFSTDISWSEHLNGAIFFLWHWKT